MGNRAMFADPTPDELVDHDPQLGNTFDAPETFTGVSFASRVHNLVLTMRAAGMSFPQLEEHQAGIKRQISPGFRLEFRGGYLVLDEALRKSWRDFLGRYGKFYFYDSDEQRGELEELAETPLEDLLREHPQFGTSNVDGFREIEAAIPPAARELELILNAALVADEDALEAIYDAELAGFKRPQVLEAAQRALEAVYESNQLAAVDRIPRENPEPPLVSEHPQGPESPLAADRGPQAPVTADSLVRRAREGDAESAGPEDV